MDNDTPRPSASVKRILDAKVARGHLARAELAATPTFTSDRDVTVYGRTWTARRDPVPSPSYPMGVTTIFDEDGDEVLQFPGEVTDIQAEALIRIHAYAFTRGAEAGRADHAAALRKLLNHGIDNG